MESGHSNGSIDPSRCSLAILPFNDNRVFGGNFGEREGFRMPARRERSTQVRGRASESPRRTNPRDSGERLAYGDFAWQRLCPGAQQLKQLRREHRVAVPAPLAALDAQQHALGLDIADLNATTSETRSPAP